MTSSDEVLQRRVEAVLNIALKTITSLNDSFLVPTAESIEKERLENGSGATAVPESQHDTAKTSSEVALDQDVKDA